jgi:hypothetical protein
MDLFCSSVVILDKLHFKALWFFADYELAANERTCVVPEAFLLFARKANIGRTGIENGNNDAVIPVTGVKDVRYVSKFGMCLSIQHFSQYFLFLLIVHSPEELCCI